MKKILLTLAICSASSAYAAGGLVTLKPKVRNVDGSVLLLNFSNAQKYCHRRGEFVPTAKEAALALFPTHVSDIYIDSSYKKISPDHENSFYIKRVEYVYPGDQEEHSFWTSSSNGSMQPLISEAYEMDEFNGGMGRLSKKYLLAVRCAVKN